ncbi:MAG: hydantoinase/oxoprolinase family protein [Xanthobacteraceae bacterium]
MLGASRYRLGVDVGGTHTDLVLLDTTDGELLVEKVASTPNNPAIGVLNGLTRLIARGVPASEIGFFAHATTITTNGLLEMRGAKVGLLITKGFRAVQEVQTQARDGNLFDYFYAKPAPIGPQSLTREIPERVDYCGTVLVPLDREAVRQAGRELARAGVEAIAVCYLFSFMNSAREQETRALLQAECPGLHVSVSSEVLPRIREWPRLSTTLLNAYLEPVMVHYIASLNEGLDKAGLRTQQRFLMQSNGGVMPFSTAIAGGRTVHTLLSGPAAGAQACAHLAHDKQCGLVTLDMGGTSADIAFIESGAPLETSESLIARRQIDVPALDLTTISAGGGSIAAIGPGGLLDVGPHSAGADPGPVCYGRGGARPTVTDADLVCGYLNPAYFLGGAQKLDLDAARGALQACIADPLGMNVLDAAAGIRRIVDMRMADAVRVFAAKRGIDLTSFTLLPFGGAGGVHAGGVATELGIRRITVPPSPGAFSALGLLCTDVVHDYVRSELRPLSGISAAHAENALCELETRARGELAAEGLSETETLFSRALDLRYSGQGYELRIPLDGLFIDRIRDVTLHAVRERFDRRHAELHGHAAKERPVELVSYRLRLRANVPKFEPREHAAAATLDPGAAVKGTRKAWFDRGLRDATVYQRTLLEVGSELTGPAIIEQFDATTVVPPEWRARVDGLRNLVLEQ